MAFMDPNVDHLLKSSAFKELAKLPEALKHSKEPHPEKVPLKKHLILAIRKFGHVLVDVGYRLERVGYAETPLKY
jgi:hypothetical protein